jgi:hypothetical protein
LRAKAYDVVVPLRRVRGKTVSADAKADDRDNDAADDRRHSQDREGHEHDGDVESVHELFS